MLSDHMEKRIEIMVFLIDCCFETKQIHDDLSNRVERST